MCGRRSSHVRSLHRGKAIDALQVLLDPVGLEPFLCNARVRRQRVDGATFGGKLALSIFQASAPVVQGWPVGDKFVERDAVTTRLIRKS